MIFQIDQFLPSLAPADAVGSEVFCIADLLSELGYRSRIYTLENWSARKTYNPAQYQFQPGKMIINHFSIGSELNLMLAGIDAPQILRFHNVTPAGLLAPGTEARRRCIAGYAQIPLAVRHAYKVWSVSKFNQDLVDSVARIPHEVLPIVRNFGVLRNESLDSDLARVVLGDRTAVNLLFVGRIEAHKGQQDLLFYLKLIREAFDRPVRLILVGAGGEQQLNKLRKLAAAYGLRTGGPDFHPADADVIFAGRVSDAVLATLYYYSDVFFCLSNHEGFGIPLIEAMTFGLPIIADPSAAVAETCSNAALMIDKKNPEAALPEIIDLLRSQEKRAGLARAGLERARLFEWGTARERFFAAVERATSPLEGHRVGLQDLSSFTRL